VFGGKAATMAAAFLLGSASGAWAQAPTAEILPASTVVPANILRFHLRFAQRADARFQRSQVELHEADGAVIDGPFLDFGQELWSADGKLLTLILDPASIKRGVSQSAAHASLMLGRIYRLVVMSGSQTASLSFVVGPPERQPLDEELWRLALPHARRAEDLTILFDRMMDAAAVEDAIRVIGPDGGVVAGRLALSLDGRRARFTPKRPWKTGGYVVQFSDLLEDVSGNRLGEALDHAAGLQARPRPGECRFRLS
jgi:hypothetical protein